MKDRRATALSTHESDVAIEEAGTPEEAAWIRHYLNIADEALFAEWPRRSPAVIFGPLSPRKFKTLHALSRDEP